MKTLFLTLVGVVGLTGVSWGQWAVNFDSEATAPNVINFTGLPTPWFNGEYTLNAVESLVDGTTEHTLAASYNGPNGLVVGITTWGPGLPAPWVGSQLNFNDGTREIVVTLDGNSAQISGHDEDGNWVDYNPDGWVASYDGGGFGPAYVPPTPSEVGGSGGAFVEHAQELNIGLTFQDGQWVPAE